MTKAYLYLQGVDTTIFLIGDVNVVLGRVLILCIIEKNPSNWV